MRTRVVMLVDLDYFFAQCEELRNPALKGKPIVVGMYSGRTEDSGAVTTANYLARKYGVKSGIPLFLAKKLLEGVEAVFLPVDFVFYEQVSNKVMQELRNYADVLEQVSIDEAYLDVTQKVAGSFEVAVDLAREMKNIVKQRVGLSFSVGVGPNKLVAKIACDSQKPDGLTVVKPDEVLSFLAPLPVGRLLGVGKKTALRMERLGIKSVGDLARFDVQRLVETFGKTLGIYFHNAANGVDNEPVKETGEAESISRMATLKEDTRDLEVIMEKANQLIEDVWRELVNRKLFFKQVGIVAVMTDLSVHSRSLTLERYTSEVAPLRTVVGQLFEKFLGESELAIRRLGVKISRFSREQAHQKQLLSYF
ncbi:MAG: DNA polymerase IV [Candidatus Bathyarchaeia archaeon]